MHVLKITRLDPGKVVDRNSQSWPAFEDEVFTEFRTWAESTGLLAKHRFVPLLGFNHPWGPEGEPRGYEIWCFVDGYDDLDLSGLVVKDFPGGLFAVTSIPGLDVIPEYATALRQAVEAHPEYALAYPEGYRHGTDPSPEYEMVYTPRAQRMEDFVLDYFVPIRRVSPPEGEKRM